MFDDNMLKLAKMQKTLLEVSTNNRQENLKKYKENVIEIDRQAFSSFLGELNKLDNHNQTLEDELRFLEQIKKGYNQLVELQSSFRNVCSLYGDDDLELSDLSQINSEYIDRRISVINGYLLNLKNIDINNKKLQELNNKLIDEEKNKSLLSKKLLDFEDSLRSNFENAEGRIVVEGKLQYISVISEYKKLGYDFNLLLRDTDTLEDLLIQVNSDKSEIEEKLKTAEICYNTNPNSDSKHILDDISKDFFRIKYRLTMLKMLELLSKNYDDYELFKEKREKLLDLIKYREICLKNLGEHISIDPFNRTKISEQINLLSSFNDNSKNISKILKDISSLGKRVDEMVEQNKEYKEKLKDTKDLVVSTVGLEDIIDKSDITMDVLEPVLIEEKIVLDNQIVSIRDVPSKFNISIVRQKTNSVINRVNQMVSTISQDVDKKKEVITPELVIVSQPTVSLDLTDELDEKEDSIGNDESLHISDLGDITDEEVVVKSSDEVISTAYDSSMFETVDPFLEAPLFFDRTDETSEIDLDTIAEKKTNTDAEFELKLDTLSGDDESSLVSDVSNSDDSSMFETVDPFLEAPLFFDRTDETSEIDLDTIAEKKTNTDTEFELKLDTLSGDDESGLVSDVSDSEVENEMPEAFWVTQGEEITEKNESDDVVLSFDEQISALLSDEENTKIKKLVV